MTAACGAGKSLSCCALIGLAIAALVGSRNRKKLRVPIAWLRALSPVVRMGAERLTLIMLLLFIGVSIPVLIFILIYNYNKNSVGIISILDEAVARTSQAGVHKRTQDLIRQH